MMANTLDELGPLGSAFASISSDDRIQNRQSNANHEPHDELFIEVEDLNISTFCVDSHKFKTPLVHMNGLEFDSTDKYKEFLHKAETAWRARRDHILPKCCLLSDVDHIPLSHHSAE